MQRLIASAEKLQRPCFHLVEAKRGDAIVGYWRGHRSYLPRTFPPEVTRYVESQHLLSVEAQLWSELGLTLRNPFAFMLHTTGEGDDEPTPVPVVSGTLSSVTFGDAIPLTARRAQSFPPFPAVCLYGDENVAAWLREQGLERWEYEEVPPQAISSFEDAWRARCPLFFNPPIVAQIGGWHIRWPEDDFYIPREMELLAWTFRDAEPWYEIFLTPMRNVVVKARIT